MTANAARRGDRVHAAWVLPLLVVLTLAATALLYVRGDLNPILCDGACPARFVTPPEGLVAATPGPDTPAGVGDGAIDAAALDKAVADALGSPSLGEHSGLVALDGRDGAVLVDAAQGAFVPASTTKVLTAFAALTELGPDARFTTSVVRDGDRVVLVGGGDPYLTEQPVKGSSVEKADLATLAKATAVKVGAGPVAVGYDVSLFTGPAVSPGWESTYVSGGVVAPVSPLWVERGRVGLGRSSDPAADAAGAFAALLRAEGVTVSGDPEQVDAPSGATAVARAHSARLARIVEAFLASSDNEVAEVLLRQAAIGAGQPASFDGGAKTVKQDLTAAGLDADGLVLRDGSGLARGNRISPTTLAQVLVESSGSTRLGALVSGLPVGGFSGTLEDRYARLGDARGLVRAKTGTLTGVHTLAGIATLSGGRPVAFAVMADDTEAVNPFVTQAALDRVAADLVACRCGG